MKRDRMKFFKRTDLIVIAIILTVSILYLVAYNYFYSDRPSKAEIYYKSELVETIDLKTGEDKIFSIEQNENVVFHLYEDGSIRFEKSDCPDKICVNSGKLSRVGEGAACLPNGITLKIVPHKKHSKDDLDIVIGKY